MLGLRVISSYLTYKIMDEVYQRESSLFINDGLNFLIKGSFIYLEILNEIIWNLHGLVVKSYLDAFIIL
jgi:hypothetical protein